MIGAGLERNAVVSYMPSQYQPPGHKMGSDVIDSWINEVSLASDSATEPPCGTWEFTQSSTSFEIPNDFSDCATARIIEEDDTRSLEYFQRQSNEPPSSTREATHERSPTTDHESQKAESTLSSSRASALEATDQRSYGLLDSIRFDNRSQEMIRLRTVMDLVQKMENSQASMDATTTIGPAVTQAVPSSSEAARVKLLAEIKSFNFQRERKALPMHGWGAANGETNEHVPSAFDSWSTVAQCGSRWCCDDNILHVPSISSTEVDVPGRDEQVPKQLQDFYDAEVQLRLMQERFCDLVAEENAQVARKDHLINQDCIPGQSDEDSNRMWDEMLSSLRETLDAAQASVQTARAVCENSNIEIPVWQSTSWSDCTELRDFWPTPAEMREFPKSAYATPCDQPGNIHPDHDSIPNERICVAGPKQVF